MASPTSRRGGMLVAGTLVLLVVFGALVGAITLKLRAQLRGQVLRREAEIIHAVAVLQTQLAERRLAELGAGAAIQDLLFDAVLESSEMRGVFAVQLFDTAGALRDAMPVAPEENAIWWPRDLREPQARFLAQGRVADVSPRLARTAGAKRLPLLDVAVPLAAASGQPLGVARYWIDGARVAAEFSRMDYQLATQATLAGVVALVLAWAFVRLSQANRRLLAQSADLARANEELDFAAKTGALGAISAHLIHGLKNPLAGLEGFVAETAGGGGEPASGDAWQTAMDTTRRLRAMVSEVATVLADETTGEGDYVVPADEVVEAARIRTGPVAERAGVALVTQADRDVKVIGRTANLAGLVLANLITNAVEASPAGGRVTLDARRENGRAEFVVSDTGPGLPAAVQAALFRPVRSTKRGGGGVGLAISHRLAKHAGGELDLVRTDANGTVFRLRVPAVA